MEADPVMTDATVFATAISKFALNATITVRRLSPPVDAGSFGRRLHHGCRQVGQGVHQAPRCPAP
jgi:hypothetical protein